MLLRYLEILETIAETESFTGAAKKLYLTQSAVSHAAAQLEKQAGTKLFERHAKGVRLTRCAYTLLKEAQPLLASSRNIEKKLSHLEQHTPIQIVSSITIATFLLPALLQHAKKSHPQFQFTVKVARASQTLHALMSKNADIAFWEGIAPKGNFHVVELGSYPLCAACSFDFPLQSSTLTFSRLCQYPLLLREPGSAIRDTLDHALALENETSSALWESTNSQALIKAAEAGLGVVVLPENLLADSFHLQNLKRIPLEQTLENQMLALVSQDQYITEPMQRLLEAIQYWKDHGNHTI